MTDGDSYQRPRSEEADKSCGLLRLSDEANQGSEGSMTGGSRGLWIPGRRPWDQGILPSRSFGVGVFSLPGHGNVSSWCGETRLRICDNVVGHVDESLDGSNSAGRYVVELYRASCGKISCPVCYEKAVGKMAIRIEWKFKHFIDEKWVKHVVVSVPTALYGVDAKKLRVMAIDVLKRCGVHGGCIIYHPWRERCAVCGAEVENILGEHLCVECGSPLTVWVYAPHFHGICVGKVHDTAENYEKNGWVVVNLGQRKSIRATAHYQLTHCGVAVGFSNVTWFGNMAHPKRKIPRLPPEKHECPICGGALHRPTLDPWMRSLMKSGLMDDVEEGIYFADPEMFEYWDPWDGDGGGADD